MNLNVNYENDLSTFKSVTKILLNPRKWNNALSKIIYFQLLLMTQKELRNIENTENTNCLSQLKLKLHALKLICRMSTRAYRTKKTAGYGKLRQLFQLSKANVCKWRSRLKRFFILAIFRNK